MWLWESPKSYALVLAPTANDIRSTCFGSPGTSGLLSVIPYQLIESYNKSIFELILKNGSIARGISADAYDRIRGSNLSYLWCDELCAFQYPQQAWDQAQFALRIGHARTLVSTTPRPIPLIADLVNRANKDVAMQRVSSYANLKNLSRSFASQISKYEGTNLGQQEIHAQIIDLSESGVIREGWLKKWPATKPLPVLTYVMMSLDTAFTEKTNKAADPDFTACTVWGVFFNVKTSCDEVILLDCWHERLGLPNLITRILKERRYQWGATEIVDAAKPLYGNYESSEIKGRQVDEILVENIGSGMAVCQMLAEYKIKTAPWQPKIDKLSRLHAASTSFAASLVWVPTNEHNKLVSWAHEWLRQCTQYCGPESLDHEDYCDSTSQAILFLQQTHRIGERMERMVKSQPPTRSVYGS